MCEEKISKLELFQPSFASELQDAILELEHLRRMSLTGTTPGFIFYQLKALFHTLESLGSARIEGNRTTLSEYIEGAVTEKIKQSEQITEIANLEIALKYIDDNITKGSIITGSFIRELQAIAVKDLTSEGDRNAGSYRNCNVSISGSTHTPPNPLLVPALMSDLIDFINRNDPPKYDLIKVALVHHRFGWIHPFANGNGRTVRLLTYAMLMKYGFNVDTAGRILNPTAVFCCNRDKYYEMLSIADTGTSEGVEQWCLYVLSGILEERKKLDILTDYKQVVSKLLAPAVSSAVTRGLINADDAAILNFVIENRTVTTGEVAAKFKIKGTSATYRLNKLKSEQLINPIEPKKRQYVPNLNCRKLIYGLIDSLSKNGFIPENLLVDR